MIYRTEHPKPQFMRQAWANLNGLWQFEYDNGLSGEARGMHNPDAQFSMEINVPFCVESKLSGIANTDFINSVWYKREVELTEEQVAGRVILHFGAVDYEAVVYVNGKKVGKHKGGYVSFSFDITDFVTAGKNVITLNAIDDTRHRLVACGKQSYKYESFGCFYTRTTGIWQTVWREFVPKDYIVATRYDTDIEAGIVTIEATVCGKGTLKAEAFYEGKPMGSAETKIYNTTGRLSIQLAETHLWEVGAGRLYDLVLTFGEDKVDSYFGMRSVRMEGYVCLINEKPVYQRLVLDQGFYPDGIYTAPSDEALKGDIELSLAMGFNGARLHEKVFEERFLYHADCLGYIVWGEYPNWGLDTTYNDVINPVLPEWMEIMRRDYNHPAIVGWCPLNECWERKQCNDFIRNIYLVTKELDRTRPCIDTSGGFHVKTDIFDIHDYEQDPEKFAEHFKDYVSEGKFFDVYARWQPYTGEPMFVSEYGGIQWAQDQAGWGYGNAPKTEEEFLSRLKGLTDVLMDNEHMLGLCYTQLTDVEQEQNGLYTYDRKPKFDPKLIHPIFARKAKIEE